MKKEDIPEVVRIYRAELPGFLSELGDGFLQTFYEASMEVPGMFTIVYEGGGGSGGCVGFVNGTTQVKDLNKKIILRRPLRFLWHILVFSVTHPLKFGKVVQSILYPGFSHEGAELLTIAVDRQHHGKGIGKKLFDACATEFKRRGVKEFEISAYDRLPANGFYKKIGCKSVRSFDFLGEKMNYYRSIVK